MIKSNFGDGFVIDRGTMSISMSNSQKRINYRLLIISLLIGCLGLITLFIVHTYSKTIFHTEFINCEVIYLFGIIFVAVSFLITIINLFILIKNEKINLLWLVGTVAFCQSVISVLFGRNILMEGENGKLIIGTPEYARPTFLIFFAISFGIFFIAIIESLKNNIMKNKQEKD